MAFAKLRAFPEYHILLSALNTFNQTETELAASYSELFTDGVFEAFAETQKDPFKAALLDLIRAGVKQNEATHEVQLAMNTIPGQFPPFLAAEGEIAKWRNMQKTVDEAAVKAEEKAASLKAQLDKATAAHKNTQKLESDYATQSRMAEDARLSAQENQSRLSVVENPYKGKFATDFVGILNGFIDARISLSQNLGNVAQELLTASQSAADYPDVRVERMKSRIVDLEKVELEEFGSVEPIDKTDFK
jgi:hypothetical protein